MPQVELMHAGVLLGRAAQAIPQPLQLLTSLVVLVSQPSAAPFMQSANPRLQIPMPHVEPAQAGRPLATGPHTMLHAPQLLGSLSMAVSQPSVAPFWQSRNPELHIPM